MSRFLFATWDGAGNLVPTLGLARRLARAGHDVRVLGHRSIQERCGTHGWRFRPFEHTPEFDSVAPGDADMPRMARQLWFNGAVARDVLGELAREAADVLIADCMLMGALSAGEAAGIPTVSLFHGAFALFRGGPLVEVLNGSLPVMNALRQDLGLRSVARVCDLHDACALSLVATPREFEPAIPLPPNVRFAGPFLDAPPLLCAADGDPSGLAGAGPLVVVSFSTSQQGQLEVLQRIVTALGSVRARAVVTTGPAIDPRAIVRSPNLDVLRFVPHDRLLPHASAVITHAGLGTVMTALAHGVPMVCVPLGRDQFFNAARVAALGTGAIVGRDAGADAIANAVCAVIADENAHAAAKRFGEVVASYRGGDQAVRDVERLAAAGSIPQTAGR